MARFIYHYIDTRGRNRLAFAEAASASACLRQLQAVGVCPVFVYGLQLPFFARRKLGKRTLAMLFRQLAQALASGVSLLEALHFIRQEQHGEGVRRFLQGLEGGVLSGRALSEALGATEKVDGMLCQWIAIGEQRGELAAVLDEVAAYLERQEKLAKRTQQQLIYPLVVLLSVFAVGGFLTLVVMPILAEQFFASQADMPWLMRFFLWWHDALAAGGIWLLLLLIIAVALSVFGVRRASDDSPGRRLLRRAVLRTRFLRRLVVLRTYVPFARLSGQLLHAGVGASEVFAEMRRYFRRSLFAEDVAALEQAIARGVPLTTAMGALPFVPALAGQMLAGGERYGHLAESLLESADYYEARLMDELALWLRFAEPAAIVLLGVLVLVLAMGLFLPILDSYQVLLSQ
ncbi:MAG: type II secretion system F family protein [Peptococcaceae bacterium]|nr:type II secretion system F family protein [Peptococcaceae bacterium]